MFKIGVIEGSTTYFALYHNEKIVSLFMVGYKGRIELILINELGGEVEAVMIKIIGNYFNRLLDYKKNNLRNISETYISNVFMDINDELLNGTLVEISNNEVSKISFESNNDLDYLRENDSLGALATWNFSDRDNNFFEINPMISVYSLDYTDYSTAMDDILLKVEEKSGIRLKYECLEYQQMFRLIMKVSFSISEKHDDIKFCFWSADAITGTTNSLHISPPYSVERHSNILINGYTDAVIFSNIINSCSSPKDTRKNVKHYGSTWSNIIHPFYVKSNEFDMNIHFDYILNRYSSEKIVDFLVGALGKSKDLVFVSGGFNSDFTYSSNIDNPYPYKPNRGSEDKVLWEYLTLKQEGKLDGAIIPDWFWEEKWLLAYATYYSIKRDIENHESVLDEELLNLLLEYQDEELFNKEAELYSFVVNDIW